LVYLPSEDENKMKFPSFLRSEPIERFGYVSLRLGCRVSADYAPSKALAHIAQSPDLTMSSNENSTIGTGNLFLPMRSIA